MLKRGLLQILIDASGEPIQSILKAGWDPLAVDLLILTHFHAGHYDRTPRREPIGKLTPGKV